MCDRDVFNVIYEERKNFRCAILCQHLPLFFSVSQAFPILFLFFFLNNETINI